MRFYALTFHQILDGGFADKRNSTLIPCAGDDTSSQGQPCIKACSLNAAGALGLALHFLSSTMWEVWEVSLQQIFALVPTIVNCYLDFALDILLKTLWGIPEAAVHLPDHNEIINNNLLICACSNTSTSSFSFHVDSAATAHIKLNYSYNLPITINETYK